MSVRSTHDADDLDDDDDDDNYENADLPSVANSPHPIPPGMGRQQNGFGHGRQKGTKNVASREIKAAIQKHGPELVKRLMTLARKKFDPQTNIAAIKVLLAYGYGRPTVHLEVGGELRRPYVVEMPNDLNHEAWMQMTMAAAHGGPRVVNPAPQNGGPVGVAQNGHATTNGQH
jgi:hypothetical protein